MTRCIPSWTITNSQPSHCVTLSHWISVPAWHTVLTDSTKIMNMTSRMGGLHCEWLGAVPDNKNKTSWGNGNRLGWPIRCTPCPKWRYDHIMCGPTTLYLTLMAEISSTHRWDTLPAGQNCYHPPAFFPFGPPLDRDNSEAMQWHE